MPDIIQGMRQAFPFLGQPQQQPQAAQIVRVPINPCAGKGFLDAYKNICDGQVGQWAIDESAKLDGMADRAPTSNDKPSRWRFANDFEECCSQDLRDLRSEIIRRLGPPAKDSDEVSAYESLMSQRFPEMVSPSDVKYYVPYLRRLGVQLKRKEIPRSKPITLRFTERQSSSRSALPVAATIMADQFGTNPNFRFPYGITATITTTHTLFSGYIVVEFDNRYGAVSCDIVGCTLADSPKFIQNKEVYDIAVNNRLKAYILSIGATPFTSDKAAHVEVHGNFPMHVTKVTYFNE